ncbi:hypothetical protein [Hymenobacter sediminicola]|uniref:Uncharacterized protein n=1 Tax=Hymenobacter sediminicola TaxID=2761579 RepID=A0A7G7W2Y6_9BACT|nr:hypothetical protein [Hymenobacter sediminicola]QNH60729.1 hypothetical protein H4317_11050 [Hymenobacter sediminicola]
MGYNPEIITPQLQRMQVGSLTSLRKQWEDQSAMTDLIDAELQSRLNRIPLTPDRLDELLQYFGSDTITEASVTICQLAVEVRRLQSDNQRLIDETHRWSAAVKKLEAERTQPYTEASVEEALQVLDDAMDKGKFLDDNALLMAIDMAAQKLRPVPAPVHDASALASRKPCPKAQGLPTCKTCWCNEQPKADG